jgi:hypothetical protein
MAGGEAGVVAPVAGMGVTVIWAMTLRGSGTHEEDEGAVQPPRDAPPPAHRDPAPADQTQLRNWDAARGTEPVRARELRRKTSPRRSAGTVQARPAGHRDHRHPHAGTARQRAPRRGRHRPVLPDQHPVAQSRTTTLPPALRSPRVLGSTTIAGLLVPGPSRRSQSRRATRGSRQRENPRARRAVVGSGCGLL